MCVSFCINKCNGYSYLLQKTKCDSLNATSRGRNPRRQLK
jgi:ribosomal protein L24E